MKTILQRREERQKITPIRRVLRKFEHLYTSGINNRTPTALAEELIAQLNIDWTCRDLKFLDVKSNCGTFSLLLVERLLDAGHDIDYILDEMIYAVDADIRQIWLTEASYQQAFGRSGNIIHVDFLQWEPDMKFDIIVGNPPYGKNANLAIKFLNKCASLSEDIRLVLPKTVRKESALKKINRHLHLVTDIDNPDSTFGGGIITCTQTWTVREQLREVVIRERNHPDFEFVKREEANIFIGRVGLAGHVKTEGYDHYSDQHYFIRAKSQEVIDRLISLQDQFIAAGKETVGMTSLARTELVRIYLETIQ